MIMKYKILILICVAFSGCTINLKSELPSINYYKLDTTLAKSSTCEAYSLIGLSGIEVPSKYQNAKILYSDNAKVSELKGVHFSNDIKNELENMLIKESYKHCLKVINPPFSGTKIESYLKLKLLDFEILKDGMEATISLLYQVTSNGQVSQAGILSKSEAIASFDEEHIIEAMQDVAILSTKELVDILKQ